METATLETPPTTSVTGAPCPTSNIEKRVAQYVKLRDMIKAMEDEHKKALKPYKETLEQLNSYLLAQLETVGGESVRTSAGTVYRTERKSASLADAEAFMKYVVANNAFDLLDRKANSTAVADFLEQHQSLPPGVNYSRMFTVGAPRLTHP